MGGSGECRRIVALSASDERDDERDTRHCHRRCLCRRRRVLTRRRRCGGSDARRPLALVRSSSPRAARQANGAEYGGAIYAYGGDAQVILKFNSALVGNTAHDGGFGGGAFVTNGALLGVSSSTFTSNSAYVRRARAASPPDHPAISRRRDKIGRAVTPVLHRQESFPTPHFMVYEYKAD